jgi:hypothetical protein
MSHGHDMTLICNASSDSPAAVRRRATKDLDSGFIGAIKMPRTNELTLLPKLPLLITESADEFDALHDAFEQEIKPRGIIERIYVHDISGIVWEILRMRRCKVVIINLALRSALQSLLRQLLRQPGQYEYDVEDEAQTLAQSWFTVQEAKKQVSEILSRFDSTSLPLKRKPSGSRPRTSSCSTGCWPLWRHVATRLGCVAEYRASLAQQLRESADRIIDGKGILRLEDTASERSTAA